ncbi:phenoloxidase-activating factor 2 [Drosophila santomea]|uniref:phenoloxidase-activating factor 2 n=1 Tax=Drosophila santomea TaxID=129105 RepID=UPI00195467AF|nr:phenoloxidase-activating factor 2 [Drosophila santomea]
MDRLCILLLVLLGTSRIQARYCGGSRANMCIQRNRCRIGTETGTPTIDFRGLSNGNQGCESGHTCCPITEILQYSVQTDNQQIPLDCGHMNRQGVSFTITNARDIAQDGELPWMVAVLDARNSQAIGGGSLIKPDVVLTSSSKTSEIPENYLIVRAGEWDFKSYTELRPHVDVPIRKIVRHPGLSMTSGASNAALLFLARPLNLDHHINLICLPPPNRNYINNLCTVSGWGKKTVSDNSYMNVLKKIEVPLVEKSVCQTQLQNFVGKEFFLDNSLMCAGGEVGKDSCKGDGGAPLVCPLQSDPNRYEQVGIVNFGFGCGKPIPAIYTDVSHIRSWIDYSILENAVNYSPPSPGQVVESIRNEGYGSGGLRYDPNGIQKPNQGGGFISYLGQGYEDNGPLPIGGHIPSVRQEYSGIGYDPNPEVGSPLFGASGAGNQNPNIRQENFASNQVEVGRNSNDLGGRTVTGGGAIQNPNKNNVNNPEFGDFTFGVLGAGDQNPNIRVGGKINDLGGRTRGGAIENPNKINVIKLGDFPTTTTTPSPPVKMVIVKA